jgi:hypothetical protein
MEQQTTGGKPKPPNAGKGRPKGVPNRATQTAREAITLLVEANIPKIGGWLTTIEQTHGPLVALRCVQEMLEFAVPKLQRTELTGDGGGPLQVVVNRLA